VVEVWEDGWYLLFVGNLSDARTHDFQVLLEELEGLQSASGTDMFGWDEGEFSVVAAYRRLSTGYPMVELDLVRDCR
jgi:hypothetical protein